MKRHDTVAENMTRGLIYLHPTNKLLTAFKMMDDHKIKHIPIINNEKLVGIISDRDILLQLSVKKGDNLEESLHIPDMYLEEIYSTNLITCSPFDTIETAARLMLRHEIDSLPVTGRDSSLVGIITSSDLMKYLAERVDHKQEPFLVEQVLKRIPVNQGLGSAYR